MARDSCKDTAGEPYFQARFKGKNMLNLWQNFLDYQAREFTIVQYDAPLLEPYFQVAMVVLLTLRADCSPVTLKPAHLSPYLPPDEKVKQHHCATTLYPFSLFARYWPEGSTTDLAPMNSGQ